MALGNDITAIERVIQTPPAGIGRIQGIPGIVKWHHELGTSDLGDFRIHTSRRDLKRLALW